MTTTFTQTVTVPATDIREQPSREGDTEVSVTVMRSCTFLVIRRGGQVTAHLDISHADWQAITAIPAPPAVTTEQESTS